MPAIDMDDLIASFASTAHISQEAMDLAMLQKQLAQTLHQYNVNPCAIPSSSTQGPLTSPSTSSWMGRDMCHRNRSTSQSRRFPSQERSWRPRHQQQYDSGDVDDDELDAQMVEQELAFGYSPSTASNMGTRPFQPTSSTSSSMHHGHSLSNSSSTETMIGGPQMQQLQMHQMQLHSQMHDPWYSTSPHAPSSTASSFQDSSSSTASSFAAYAAIDPFFAAQVQAASAVYGSTANGFSSSHQHAFAAPN